MNVLERNYYNAFVRMRDFGAENAADFPANAAGAVNFGAVGAAAEAMDESGAVQSSGEGRQMTRRKELAANELREDLRAINRTARALTVDDEDFIELFRMPYGGSEQKLLAAARAFLANATPHRNKFIEFGLPADFLEDLQADIADFEQAASDKGAAVGGQAGATATISEAVKSGLEALRRLRAIVPNVYRNNPAKLAAWASASRVERTAKKKVSGNAEENKTDS